MTSLGQHIDDARRRVAHARAVVVRLSVGEPEGSGRLLSPASQHARCDAAVVGLLARAEALREGLEGWWSPGALDPVTARALRCVSGRDPSDALLGALVDGLDAADLDGRGDVVRALVRVDAARVCDALQARLEAAPSDKAALAARAQGCVAYLLAARCDQGGAEAGPLAALAARVERAGRGALPLSERLALEWARRPLPAPEVRWFDVEARFWRACLRAEGAAWSPDADEADDAALRAWCEAWMGLVRGVRPGERLPDVAGWLGERPAPSEAVALVALLALRGRFGVDLASGVPEVWFAERVRADPERALPLLRSLIAHRTTHAWPWDVPVQGAVSAVGYGDLRLPQAAGVVGLVRGVCSPSKPTRDKAAQWLARGHGEEAVGWFEALLQARKAAVRAAAVQGLGLVPGARATEALEGALSRERSAKGRELIGATLGARAPASEAAKVARRGAAGVYDTVQGDTANALLAELRGVLAGRASEVAWARAVDLVARLRRVGAGEVGMEYLRQGGAALLGKPYAARPWTWRGWSAAAGVGAEGEEVWIPASEFLQAEARGAFLGAHLPEWEAGYAEAHRLSADGVAQFCAWMVAGWRWCAEHRVGLDRMNLRVDGIGSAEAMRARCEARGRVASLRLWNGFGVQLVHARVQEDIGLYTYSRGRSLTVSVPPEHPLRQRDALGFADKHGRYSLSALLRGAASGS